MASIPFTRSARGARGRILRSSGNDGGAKSWDWMVPLIPTALAVFLLSGLTYYRTQGADPGGLLSGFVIGLHDFLGFEPAFMLCLLTTAWSSIWFFTGAVDRPLRKIGQILALTVSLAILVNLQPDGALPERGGALGGFFALRLTDLLGFAASSLLVAAAGLVFLWQATDNFFYRYFEGIGRPRDRAGLEDGVESATVQAFESLAAPGTAPARAGRSSATSAPSASRAADLPPGRPTQVVEEDPLDRVFPGPLETVRVIQPGSAAGSATAEAEEEAVAEEIVDEIQVPDSVTWEEEEDVEVDADDEEVALEQDEEEDEDEAWEYEEDEEEDADAETVTAAATAAPALEEEEEEAADEDELYFEEDEEEEEFVPSTARLWDEDEEFGEEELEISEEEEDEEDLEVEEDEEEIEDEDEAPFAEPVTIETPVVASEPVAVEPGQEEFLFGLEDAEEAMEIASVDLDPAAEGSATEDPVAEDPVSEDVDEEVVVIEPSAPLASDDEPVGEAEPAVVLPRPEERRQQTLFVRDTGDELLEEAAQLVVESGRASTGFLKRRLRVDADEAQAIFDALRQRGIVECAPGASQGRVVADPG